MFKGIFINLSCAALAVIANALLKQALHGRIAWKGSVLTLFTDAFGLLRYPLVWLGAASFVAANVLWLFILATQRMSVAYPLQLSLVFLFATLASILVFSEKVTVPGMLGLALVVSGVVLVSRG
jgi:multidrug transporter EmrE-like cation transporter